VKKTLFLVVTTTIVAWVALFFIASMRYAVALVDPPLPSPDYGLQTLIAYVGVALSGVAGVVTVIVAVRRQQGRDRGCAVVLMIAAAAAVSALTFPRS